MSKVRIVDEGQHKKAQDDRTVPVKIRVQLKRFFRPRTFEFHNKNME